MREKKKERDRHRQTDMSDIKWECRFDNEDNLQGRGSLTKSLNEVRMF